MSKGNQKYTITLSTEERKKLQAYINSGLLSYRSLKRAQILLAVDLNAPLYSNQKDLAASLGISVPTIITTTKDYLNLGLDACLKSKHHV